MVFITKQSSIAFASSPNALPEESLQPSLDTVSTIRYRGRNRHLSKDETHFCGKPTNTNDK